MTYRDGDPWPGGTDGGGHSLTFTGGAPDSPHSWRPSVLPGGSPGVSDAVPFTGGDLLGYAIAGLSVRGEADDPPEFRIRTRLGSDDAVIHAEWSADLETWSSDGLQRGGQVPIGDGLAEEAWTLPDRAESTLFFRAVVTTR